LGVTPIEHSLAAKSVQMRTLSGKCNKPASAVFARGHGLKVSKPNPGSLSFIMAKIALKGKCLETMQPLRLHPPVSFTDWENKVLEMANAISKPIFILYTRSQIQVDRANFDKKDGVN